MCLIFMGLCQFIMKIYMYVLYIHKTYIEGKRETERQRMNEERDERM